MIRSAILSPSHILEGIQSRSIIYLIAYSYLIFIDAYIPPALRMSGVIQAYLEPKPPVPPPSEFWEIAKKYEQTLQGYVHRLLESGAAYFNSANFTVISSSMNHIVNATATFRDNIQGTSDAHNITLDMLTEELEGIFMAIVHDLEKIPPPDKAPGHAERAKMVDQILSDTTWALVQLAARHGIEEEVVMQYLLVLIPQVQILTVAVGMSSPATNKSGLNRPIA